MSEKSKYQKFTFETIKRSDIINAEYNPRIMDKEAKKRLKKNLKENGLVSAITWNRRTKRICGGHMRLEQLDALEKNKDYSLDVCVVDVDEKTEAKLNVILNNPSMQGDWDLDKLASITEEFDVSFDDMGFTKLDVDFLFDGDDRFSEMFETEEKHEAVEALTKVKEAREQQRENYKDLNNMNYYTVIVFADAKERDEFHRKISVPPAEKYVTAEKIYRLEND